jgi:FKBP-type peptidyl-prolyl cis-trans isomerase SlyD
MRGVAVGTILCAVLGVASCQGEKEEMTIATGTNVSLEYTLKLEDETVVDTNVGANPLTYTHGSSQIIPGLEKELVGMKVGESKQVTVPPEDGYGVVNPEAIQEVPKQQLTPDALQVGAHLQGRDPSGRSVRARVAEVKDQTVVLDFNHPLAGKTLHFDVKVLDIQQPPTQ